MNLHAIDAGGRCGNAALRGGHRRGRARPGPRSKWSLARRVLRGPTRHSFLRPGRREDVLRAPDPRTGRRLERRGRGPYDRRSNGHRKGLGRPRPAGAPRRHPRLRDGDVRLDRAPFDVGKVVV